MNAESLDQFDQKILDLLSQDARQTGAALAEKVGLSPASCLRRVQRLRKIGAIEREVAIVSRAYSANRVTILVRLQVARVGGDRIDRLRRKFGGLPAVQKVYHVTGDCDLVLILSFPSMEDYAGFTNAHFYDDMIRGFDSMVVLTELAGSDGAEAT